MHWNQIVSKVSPYIVKIETPTGSGTGFLCFYNEDKTLCGVATALHVVNHADEWQQPIKIIHHQSGKIGFLKESDRIIFPNRKADSAVVLFQKGNLPFPEEPIPLLPIENPISIGVEVGWLGFPAMEPFTLCFFSGSISARKEDSKAYLIDGVAINGVSGGPVLYSTGTEGVQIVGTISAYWANRLRGEALPGISIAQDVSPFHKVIQHLRSIEEGQKKKQEQSEPKAQEKNGTDNC